VTNMPDSSTPGTRTPESRALNEMRHRQARSGLDVVLRTRRSVMEAANQIQVQRVRNRRQVGIALLSLGSLLVLLTPAIWSAVDDLFGGEHFFDMPTMVLSLVLLLFSAVFGVLIFSWSRQDRLHNGE
jgi:hypothetical protein